MANDYVKVRPYVAKRIGVLGTRLRYADGSVRLWLADMRMIDNGYLFRPDEVTAAVGGLRLTPYEAYQEQESTAARCRPLPEPQSEEWLPRPDEEAEGLSRIWSDEGYVQPGAENADSPDAVEEKGDEGEEVEP